MSSRADKIGKKKRERAQKLKGRKVAASKEVSEDGAAKKFGVFQLWLVAGLFVLAAGLIIFAYS